MALLAMAELAVLEAGALYLALLPNAKASSKHASICACGVRRSWRQRADEWEVARDSAIVGQVGG